MVIHSWQCASVYQQWLPALPEYCDFGQVTTIKLNIFERFILWALRFIMFCSMLFPDWLLGAFNNRDVNANEDRGRLVRRLQGGGEEWRGCRWAA